MSIFDNNFPRFDLEGIHLREILITDAQRYHTYMNKPQVTEFLTQDNIPVTMSAAIDDVRYWGNLFNTRRSIYWAIALSETDELIGTIGFNSWNRFHNRAELSYDLDPLCWGHGIMTRCLNRILKFAHEEMKMMRIQATVVDTNSRSIKLLERCSFDKEGFLKKYEIVGGKYMDYYLYSLVN